MTTSRSVFQTFAIWDCMSVSHATRTHTHTSMIIHVYTYIFIWFHMYTCALRPQRGLGWILDTTCFEWKNAQFKSQSEEVKSSHWTPGQMFQVQNRFPSWWSFPPKKIKKMHSGSPVPKHAIFGAVLLGRLRKRLSGKILDHPYVAAQAEVIGQGLKTSCCWFGCSKGWG